MGNVLIIGSGLAGLSCALELAQRQIPSVLVSPYPSERAQSVMAAGGINAALGADDHPALHAEDTVTGGCRIADPAAVQAMCEAAPDIIRRLEQLGTVFSETAEGTLELRAFGGQSRKRTAYAGTCTGKQIMTALIREARRYECSGLIRRETGVQFHSALLRDGQCSGALLYDERSGQLRAVYADAVVMATGGQNALFGKTTGSTICDGYAVGRLLQQGAAVKNPEFIQYHPTTVETPQKRMLISEAARGEGGRLYYMENGRRVYFMEDRFGPNGNLMPRDVVSRCIYEAPSQVYLDIACLGRAKIRSRLAEVEELCRKYAGLDVTKDSIPVAPSVHFFMGGLAVDRQHRTTVRRLYAIGECAAAYHGANRLGGNSLLSAIYGGGVAAAAIAELPAPEAVPDFSDFLAEQQQAIAAMKASRSPFSAMYLRYELAALMQDCLGICRTEEKLREGLTTLEYYLSVSDKLSFDEDTSVYVVYSLKPMLVLAKAILTAALHRTESRGAHYRADFPEPQEAFRCATTVLWEDGQCRITFEQEGQPCM